jgi:hypothetical protein
MSNSQERKLENDAHKLDGSTMRESSEKPSSPPALKPKSLNLDEQIWFNLQKKSSKRSQNLFKKL